MQNFDELSDSRNRDIAFIEGFFKTVCYIASQSDDAEYNALKARITTPLDFEAESRHKTYEKFGMVYVALIEELSRVGFFLSIAARFEAIADARDIQISHELFTQAMLIAVKEHLMLGLDNKEKIAMVEEMVENIKTKHRELRREAQV